MKNKDIFKLYEGLSSLSQIKFKPKTTFILTKDWMQLKPLYKIIINCQRQIWKQYGNQLSDGSITIPNEKIDEANKAMDDLMNLDNEIILDKISIEDFGDEIISMDLLEKLMDIIKA